MWRAAYRLLLWLAFPFVLARLWWRGRHEPGYRHNIAERFGFYPTRPARPVVWLHAVSVGETRAAERLLRALRKSPETSSLTLIRAPGANHSRRNSGTGLAVEQCCLPQAPAKERKSCCLTLWNKTLSATHFSSLCRGTRNGSTR